MDLDPILLARIQFGFTISFHIIFPSFSIGLAAWLTVLEALRLKTDYLEARYNLGRAYLSQKQIDEAISEFTAILRRHPDFAPAQRGLIEARQLQGK